MRSSKICPYHSFTLQSSLATDQHPDSTQNNSHLFPHCLWWRVQLLHTSPSCFISTLLSLRSSVLHQWAGGPWGRDPFSFSTSDLSSRTFFLLLSRVPLHFFPLMSPLKTYHFFSACWFVLLFSVYHQPVTGNACICSACLWMWWMCASVSLCQLSYEMGCHKYYHYYDSAVKQMLACWYTTLLLFPTGWEIL